MVGNARDESNGDENSKEVYDFDEASGERFESDSKDGGKERCGSHAAPKSELSLLLVGFDFDFQLWLLPRGNRCVAIGYFEN